jgi:mannose-6-phosphate isomerase-like protein (cupin superfamily)
MKINFKPWGKEEVIVENEYYRIKRIIVDPGCRTSLQSHEHKIETHIYPDGTIKHIPPKTIHRITGPTTVLEICHGDDSDIIRIDDDYCRN